MAACSWRASRGFSAGLGPASSCSTARSCSAWTSAWERSVSMVTRPPPSSCLHGKAGVRQRPVVVLTHHDCPHGGGRATSRDAGEDGDRGVCFIRFFLSFIHLL